MLGFITFHVFYQANKIRTKMSVHYLITNFNSHIKNQGAKKLISLKSQIDNKTREISCMRAKNSKPVG